MPKEGKEAKGGRILHRRLLLGERSFWSLELRFVCMRIVGGGR